MKKVVYLTMVMAAALSLSACAGMQRLDADMVFVKGHGFMHMKDADDLEDAMNVDLKPGQKMRTAYDHFPVQDDSGRRM